MKQNNFCDPDLQKYDLAVINSMGKMHEDAKGMYHLCKCSLGAEGEGVGDELGEVGGDTEGDWDWDCEAGGDMEGDLDCESGGDTEGEIVEDEDSWGDRVGNASREHRTRFACKGKVCNQFLAWGH